MIYINLTTKTPPYLLFVDVCLFFPSFPVLLPTNSLPLFLLIFFSPINLLGCYYFMVLIILSKLKDLNSKICFPNYYTFFYRKGSLFLLLVYFYTQDKTNWRRVLIYVYLFHLFFHPFFYYIKAKIRYQNVETILNILYVIVSQTGNDIQVICKQFGRHGINHFFFSFLFI